VYSVKSYNVVKVKMQSFGLDTSPQSFCYSFIGLCPVDNTLFEVRSESAHKSAVHVCQVATVVIEITHLFLKPILTSKQIARQLRTRNVEGIYRLNYR